MASANPTPLVAELQSKWYTLGWESGLVWPEHIFEIVEIFCKILEKNCGNFLAQIVKKYVEIYIKMSVLIPISYHKISNTSLFLHMGMSNLWPVVMIFWKIWEFSIISQNILGVYYSPHNCGVRGITRSKCSILTEHFNVHKVFNFQFLF